MLGGGTFSQATARTVLEGQVGHLFCDRSLPPCKQTYTLPPVSWEIKGYRPAECAHHLRTLVLLCLAAAQRQQARVDVPESR